MVFTVNTTFWLLCKPFEITLTGPVAAPDGTVAIIWLSLQLVMDVASTPPKLSVLLP
jgi:hypothetical protein